MPLYSYRCPEGHETEMVRPMGTETATCPCGKTAKRGHVHRVIAIGAEADIRGMYRRFTEATAEGASPNYNMAKAKAAAIAARGEELSIRS